ncbi:MAG: DUF4234 domain-containing protein [Bacteriovoracaceae bacterium]|jgi:hypothetical protein|nr:DUF4234 domain-containing protein [Bacteriovoracaceae bacterium]
MAINLKHHTTGLVKEVPEGFSWKSFFFAGLLPLFRGMWSAFFITLFTCGIANLYYMFKINKLYTVKLLEEGYKPVSQVDVDKIKSAGIILAENQPQVNDEPPKLEQIAA